MRRQDYKLLARIFASTKPARNMPNELAMWSFILTKLSLAFEAEHEGFDRPRFLRMVEEAGR